MKTLTFDEIIARLEPHHVEHIQHGADQQDYIYSDLPIYVEYVKDYDHDSVYMLTGRLHTIALVDRLAYALLQSLNGFVTSDGYTHHSIYFSEGEMKCTNRWYIVDIIAGDQ